MYTDLIESNTDLKVDQKFNLNGGSFCFDALNNDSIDMFVEYTGTALSDMLHEPIENDPDTVYNKVKDLMMERHNIHVSELLGFNNTYVMSVKPELAEKYNLKTLSDLMKVQISLNLDVQLNLYKEKTVFHYLKRLLIVSLKV